MGRLAVYHPCWFRHQDSMTLPHAARQNDHWDQQQQQEQHDHHDQANAATGKAVARAGRVPEA
jgi:hypothetical protein